MKDQNNSGWYLFKDQHGSPIVFYNCETGEHSWAPKYQNVKVERVSFTKYHHTNHRQVLIPRGKIKTQSIATQTSPSRNPSSDVYNREENNVNRASSRFYFKADGNSYHQSSLGHEYDNSIKEYCPFVIHQKDYDVYDQCSDVIEENDRVNLGNDHLNDQRISTELEKDFDDDYFDGKSDYANGKESLLDNLFAMELSSVLTDDDLQHRSLCQDDAAIVDLQGSSHNLTNYQKTHVDEVQSACDNSSSRDSELILKQSHQTSQSSYETATSGTVINATNTSAHGLHNSCQFMKPNDRSDTLLNSTAVDTPPGSNVSYRALRKTCMNASEPIKHIYQTVALDKMQNISRKTTPSNDSKGELKSSRASTYKDMRVKPLKRKRFCQADASDIAPEATHKTACNANTRLELRKGRQINKKVKKKKREIINGSQRESLCEKVVSNKVPGESHRSISTGTQPSIECNHQSVKNDTPKCLNEPGVSSTAQAQDTRPVNSAPIDVLSASKKSLLYLRTEDIILLEGLEKEIDKELKLIDMDHPSPVKTKKDQTDDIEQEPEDKAGDLNDIEPPGPVKYKEEPISDDIEEEPEDKDGELDDMDPPSPVKIKGEPSDDIEEEPEDEDGDLIDVDPPSPVKIKGEPSDDIEEEPEDEDGDLIDMEAPGPVKIKEEPGDDIEEEPEDKDRDLIDMEYSLSIKIKKESDAKIDEEPGETSTNAANSEGFCLVDLLPKMNKNRKHKCVFCGVSFPRRHNVKRHIEFTHPEEAKTKQRRHECTICDKSFLMADCLKKHMRTHSGEKPYRCPYCDKPFSQVQNLNKHKYIHTGQKPHKCKECGKAFRQHSHLARHILIHSGEKPYQCGQCLRSYRTRSHVVRHLKSSNHKGGVVVKTSSSKD